MKKLLLLFVGCLIMIQTITANDGNKSAIEKKSITIYWDASLSMNEKDLDKEIVFLDAYFRSIQNAEVRLVAFSNSIDIQKEFLVLDSNWSTLKEQLLSIKYEGVASYGLLTSELDSEINFLFTDGRGVFDKLSLQGNKPTYVISTQSSSDNFVLSAESRKSKGNHINLNRTDVEKALLSLGIKLSFKLGKGKSKLGSNKTKKTVNDHITGNVYSFSGALDGAAVIIKNTKTGVTTDAKGRFSIKAKKGDQLVFSFVGKKSVTVTVESLDELTVFLYEDENVLDEVTVESNKVEKELVDVGYKKVDKKKIGYAVKTIDGDKINSGVASNLSDAIAGKMGATKNGNQDLSRTIFRGGNTILGNKFPLIVIDGLPLKRNNSNSGDQFSKVFSDIVDPNNVAKVTVLRGMAASNRFGSEGVNGVILITTKTSLGGTKAVKKKENTALVKGNDYDENIELGSVTNNLKYYKEFKACKSAEEVYSLYLSKRDKNSLKAEFYVEFSNYMTQWNNDKLALRIFLNAVETNTSNVSVLKYAAYQAEQHKFYSEAIMMYQKIIQLKPKEAQSYRDLAAVYATAGKLQESLDAYNNIYNNAYSQVQFSGLLKSLNSEMKQLVLKNKSKLNTSKTPSRFLNLKAKSVQARLVFEWNTTEAEFELQFVNPQKKFFKWSHTAVENGSRLAKEKQQGFYTEEFLLDGIGTGQWIINLENKSTTGNKPVVVKFTLYKNYGGANEVKTTKLVLLNNLRDKIMISKIDF